jgi:hypothetical protein
VYRYCCCHCRRTFRHYPEGVDGADQTHRLRKLAALCWTLGFSYRSIASVFEAFGVLISRMTALRLRLYRIKEGVPVVRWSVNFNSWAARTGTVFRLRAGSRRTRSRLPENASGSLVRQTSDHAPCPVLRRVAVEQAAEAHRSTTRANWQACRSKRPGTPTLTALGNRSVA